MDIPSFNLYDMFNFFRTILIHLYICKILLQLTYQSSDKISLSSQHCIYARIVYFV